MKLHKSKLVSRVISEYIDLINAKYVGNGMHNDGRHRKWCNALDELDMISDCHYTEAGADVSVEDTLRMATKAIKTGKKIFAHESNQVYSGWYFVGDAREIAKRIERLERRIS